MREGIWGPLREWLDGRWGGGGGGGGGEETPSVIRIVHQTLVMEMESEPLLLLLCKMTLTPAVRLYGVVAAANRQGWSGAAVRRRTIVLF